MRISIIVAAADNGIIGIGNRMPWHISADLKYFKRVTMGKPVVMGRKTMESIGRALPGRENIVISRQSDLEQAGFTIVPSFQAAVARLEADGVPEAMVIGGAQIYAQAMPHASRIYLTEIHAAYEGDTSFERPDRAVWREISRDPQPATEEVPAYSWVVYERRTAGET